MSEQNLENTITPPPQESLPGIEELVIKINRQTGELIFSDPKTGKETKVKAKFIEEDKDNFELKPPLGVSEFQKVWEKLKKLGVTWNTDIPPTAVTPPTTDEVFWNEFNGLQQEYPSFQNELGDVVLHALLHPTLNTPSDQKAQIIGDLLTQQYRAEFFFKYAVKVSSFEEIDWEVVTKEYEKGTAQMPRIAYALLSLVLRKPLNTTLSLQEAANSYLEPEFITVAVNERIVNKLINRLTEVKIALENAQSAITHLPNKGKEESSDESPS